MGCARLQGEGVGGSNIPVFNRVRTQARSLRRPASVEAQWRRSCRVARGPKRHW